MDDRIELAAALTEAAQDLRSQPDLEATLQRVVGRATTVLPEIDHAGVTRLCRDGVVATVAATDELALRLDALQYELGEGPCLDAMGHEPVVALQAPGEGTPWPTFARKSAELGLQAHLAVRLDVSGLSLMSLNLYSTTPCELDSRTCTAARLYACHAALALEEVKHEQDLNAGLATRKVIGQALGILMERYELDDESAFAYLVRVSQNSNVKLRAVAEEVVGITNRRNGRPGTDLDPRMARSTAKGGRRRNSA